MGCIYQGGYTRASDIECVKELRIGLVVNCTTNIEVPPWHGQPDAPKRLRFPIAAGDIYDAKRRGSRVLPYFERLHTVVSSALQVGDSVFIHCRAGAHRAGTCTAAYAVMAFDLTPKEAVREVSKQRRVTSVTGDSLWLLWAPSTPSCRARCRQLQRLLLRQRALPRQRPLQRRQRPLPRQGQRPLQSARRAGRASLSHPPHRQTSLRSSCLRPKAPRPLALCSSRPPPRERPAASTPPSRCRPQASRRRTLRPKRAQTKHLRPLQRLPRVCPTERPSGACSS